ncbi:putative quinol monooxygenase [Bosea spartocytisi]|uniref:putative quinol monooxygenase n=1 Tax=Bosea spartocytisi TaxID=2773451 RepID=UPI00384C3278
MRGRGSRKARHGRRAAQGYAPARGAGSQRAPQPDLHEDRTAPGHFIFYEIFATEADFQARNATPHVQA